MSQFLSMLKEKEVYIGTDTAMSLQVNNKHYRIADMEMEKFKIVDNKIIAGVGKIDLFDKVINEFIVSEDKSIEKLLKICRKYKSDFTMLTDFMLVEMINKKPYLHIISKKNHPNISYITVTVNEGYYYILDADKQILQRNKLNEYIDISVGFSDGAGGVFKEKLRCNSDLIKAYKSTFETISCPEIGGTLNIVKLTANGVDRVYKNKIREDIREEQKIYANAIGGSINIGNENFTVDTSGNLNANNASIRGNITMTSGSISWSNVSAPNYSDIQGTKPPSNADVTSTVLTSTSVYAPYLRVNSAYIQGEITAGEVTTKQDGKIVSELYKDTNGGVLFINDSNGNRNVKIGSEAGTTTTDNSGGTMILYNKSNSKPRVEMSTENSTDGGRIQLKDTNGNGRIVLSGRGSVPFMGIFDNNETVTTYLTNGAGYINNERIATEEWVKQYVASQLDTSSV